MVLRTCPTVPRGETCLFGARKRSRSREETGLAHGASWSLREGMKPLGMRGGGLLSHHVDWSMQFIDIEFVHLIR